MHELLARQFGLPYWRAWGAAFRAARAAVLFQRGHNCADYLMALPDVERYYGTIRRWSTQWFIRIGWRRSNWSGGLSTANEAGIRRAIWTARWRNCKWRIYAQPVTDFAEHARARAEAMAIRDSAGERGGPGEAEWRRIEALLERSWGSLERAVAR